MTFVSELEWALSESGKVTVLEDIITDPLVSGQSLMLTSTGIRRTLIDLHQYQHWTGLKVACLPYADHSVSHSLLKNTALKEYLARNGRILA